MYWLPSLPPSHSRPLVSWITCAEGEAKACESCSNRISQSTSTRQNHISMGDPWFIVPVTLGTVLVLHQASSRNFWLQVTGRGCQQRQPWCCLKAPWLSWAPEGSSSCCCLRERATFTPALTNSCWGPTPDISPQPQPQQLGCKVPMWPPALQRQQGAAGRISPRT